jgi:hypothetical protein
MCWKNVFDEEQAADPRVAAGGGADGGFRSEYRGAGVLTAGRATQSGAYGTTTNWPDPRFTAMTAPDSGA